MQKPVTPSRAPLISGCSASVERAASMRAKAGPLRRCRSRIVRTTHRKGAPAPS